MRTSRNSIAAQCLWFARTALGKDTPHGKELSALCLSLQKSTGDHVFSEDALMDCDTLFAVQRLIDIELAFLDRCEAHGSDYRETDPSLWPEGFLEKLPQSNLKLHEEEKYGDR